MSIDKSVIKNKQGNESNQQSVLVNGQLGLRLQEVS